MWDLSTSVCNRYLQFLLLQGQNKTYKLSYRILVNKQQPPEITNSLSLKNGPTVLLLQTTIQFHVQKTVINRVRMELILCHFSDLKVQSHHVGSS